jgi:hypothetical protein
MYFENLIRLLMLVSLLTIPLLSHANHGTGMPNNLYIAGFVFDDQEQGVTEAEIVVEYQNRKLFSLRSTEAGWFESTTPIPVEHIGKQIRLTVLKRGFRLQSKDLTLKKLDNFVVFHLKAIKDIPVISYSDALATGVVYGYIYHPSHDKPLTGAKASLKIDKTVIDVSFSRDSGYFTLNYPIKYFGENATLIIEHPKYDVYKDSIQLSQQTAIKRIFFLKDKPFETDWLVRVSGILLTNDETQGGFAPLKYEFNYLKLIDVMLFSEPLYDPAAEFVWTFSGVEHKTRSISDVTTLLVGGVWKPEGRMQKTKIAIDFAIGYGWLEDRLDRSISDTVYLQAGISKYLAKSKDFASIASPNIRTEISAFRENDDWRLLWSVGIGL